MYLGRMAPIVPMALKQGSFVGNAVALPLWGTIEPSLIVDAWPLLDQPQCPAELPTFGQSRAARFRRAPVRTCHTISGIKRHEPRASSLSLVDEFWTS